MVGRDAAQHEEDVIHKDPSVQTIEEAERSNQTAHLREGQTVQLKEGQHHEAETDDERLMEDYLNIDIAHGENKLPKAIKEEEDRLQRQYVKKRD